MTATEMNVASTTIVPSRAEETDSASWTASPCLVAAALTAITALSLVLGLYHLGRDGTANAYYAAAVKSMTDNWHAFFFVSWDKAGFVSVDKPPLGLWIQAIFAMLFGFHGWSILLPQVLAATGSVVVLHFVVARTFGAGAGLIAALALAIAPINVATSRNNTADSVLALFMLLAAFATIIATERLSIGWFTAAMVLIGLGFNVKMMEAYLALPALVAAWVLAPAHAWNAERGWRLRWPGWQRKLPGLLVGGLTLLVVSFSWATVVELTPARDRPYIGSSGDNNIFTLIFGYNGINRLLPHGQSLFGITGTSGTSPGFGSGTFGGGSGGTGENGPTGVFRLLNASLGGQIGWLVVFAILGGAVAWGTSSWWRPNRERTALVVWGGWFIAMAIFFSVAGFYHRYYLTTMSPAVAALTGIGAVALWRNYRRGGRRAVLLPAALAGAACSQIDILHHDEIWNDRLTPPIIVLAAIATFGLAARRAIAFSAWIPRGLFAIGMATLLLAPAAWSCLTVQDATANVSMPVAGPETGSFGLGAFLGRFSGGRTLTAASPGDGKRTGPTSDATLNYLLANKGSDRWIVAVPNSTSGDELILDSGEAVMSLGGFDGMDDILTLDAFKDLVARGEVRFYLSDGFGGFGRGTNDISAWIESTCQVVPQATIEAGTVSPAPAAETTKPTRIADRVAGSGTLYDCAGAVANQP